MSNKTISLAVLVAFGLCGLAALGQEPASNAAITGVWRVKDQGHPTISLVVTDEGGGLAGAIVFYFFRQDTPDGAVLSTPGLPEPLLHPQFDGTTLRFEVSQRRANPPRSLSYPPNQFHLTLTGPNTGEIVNESEPDLAVPIVRSDG